MLRPGRRSQRGTAPVSRRRGDDRSIETAVDQCRDRFMRRSLGVVEGLLDDGGNPPARGNLVPLLGRPLRDLLGLPTPPCG